MGVLEFLRDVGKHVTVNTMLAKESVRGPDGERGRHLLHRVQLHAVAGQRLPAPVRHHGCELQIGGSDQWGNITAGIDLIRRTSGGHVHGLTVPLVTRADGQKFGKSVEGPVWLDPPSAPRPTQFYQYFVNVDDRDVERFLLQLTLLPVAEVAEVMARHAEAPERRAAQQALARAVTALVHGDDEAERAAGASQGFTRSRRRARGGGVGRAGRQPAQRAPGARRSRPAPGRPPGGARRPEVQERGAAPGRPGWALPQRRRRWPPTASSTADDLVEGGWAMVRKGKKQRYVLRLTGV